MTLRPYEYRDPGEVVAEVTRRRPLREGDVVLALVRDPPGDQEVVRLRSISRTQRHGLDWYGRVRILADHAERLRVPRRRGLEGPWHAIVTIVARRGYAVIGPDEGAWLGA